MKKSCAKWVNIKANAKKIHNLEDKLRKIKENLRYEGFPQKRAKISQRIHSLASKISNLKCKETSKQEQQLVQKVRVDSKSFYKYARRLKPNNDIGPIKDGEQLLTGDKDIADVLQRQFLSVYSHPTEKIENVHEFCMSEIKEGDLNEIAIERQKLILIQIGNYIRNRELDSIGVVEVRHNARTGIRIKSSKQVFLNSKIDQNLKEVFHITPLFSTIFLMI